MIRIARKDNAGSNLNYNLLTEVDDDGENPGEVEEKEDGRR